MTGGGDLSEQLSKMLSDPAAMSQVMRIAGALMNQQTEPSAEAEMSADAPAEKEASEKQASEAPALPSALPQMLSMLTDGAKDDPRTALLTALKPYLSEARRERADALIRAMRFASVAEKFLSEVKK